MSANFPHPVYAWNLFNEIKFRLQGDMLKPGDVRSRPTLFVNIKDNVPMLSFWLNNGGETKVQNVAFEKIEDYVMLMEMIIGAANNPANDKTTMEVFAFTFFNGTRSETPQKTVAITVGRNSEGVVYMSAHFKKEQPVSINFMPTSSVDGTPFIRLLGGNGEPVSSSVLSSLKARAWAIAFRDMVLSSVIKNAAEPVKKEPKQGGNGGGYKSPSFDNDVSF